MKKLVILILALSLLLPAVAFAADKEVSEFYGYCHLEVAKDGTPFMSVIFFAPDQTCYFVTQMFRHDEPGLGRSYVGFWGYTSDGGVFAKVGDNVTLNFTISSFGDIVDKNTLDVYSKFDTLLK